MLSYHLLLWFTPRSGSADIKRVFDLLRAGDIADEIDLAKFLTACPELAPMLQVSPDDCIAGLNRASAGIKRGSRLSVLHMFRAAQRFTVSRRASGAEAPDARDLFVALAFYASPGVKAALNEAGLQVAQMVFRIAHGKDEAEFAAQHTGAEEGVSIEVVNDSYTPMEFVATALTQRFGLTRKEAVNHMLQTHYKGCAVFGKHLPAQAAEMVAMANAAAREKNYPLLFRVTAAQTSLPAGNLAADMAAFQVYREQQRAIALGRRGKLFWFFATAGLFLVVGGLLFSWQFVPILFGVIAIHELGHYAAMRLTGYQNVAVFFVPGLGGLATGEKAAASPFEKLFVYLAGPMPGILLAIAALFATLHGKLDIPWIANFMWVSLLINYLNLLPITPLDGGRVVETFVFARLPLLRFVFALFCCALLLGAAWWASDPVMAIIGILIALSLPFQWRLMMADRAVPRKENEVLSEDDAVARIFATFEQDLFKRWSLTQRHHVATALMAELVGRRAKWKEAIAGLSIYAACFVLPLGIALPAIPEFKALAAAIGNISDYEKDDVVYEPVKEMAPEPEWDKLLADSASQSMEQRLPLLIGAAKSAYEREDQQTALRRYQEAWELAKDRAARDLYRIDAMLGLASVAEPAEQAQAWLLRVTQDLPSPQDLERLRVAEAKQGLSYMSNLDVFERVALQRDVVALQATELAKDDISLLQARQMLAHLLDAADDTAGAEKELRTVLDAYAQPDAGDRSSKALAHRVGRATANTELSWFLLAHDRVAEAKSVATETLNALPPKITLSWLSVETGALEVLLSIELELREADAVHGTWQRLVAARKRGGMGASIIVLPFEADRALVAQAIGDAKMLEEARQGMTKAAARFTGGPQPIHFCRRIEKDGHANWQRKRHEARVRVLTEAGVCRADHS